MVQRAPDIQGELTSIFPFGGRHGPGATHPTVCHFKASHPFPKSQSLSWTHSFDQSWGGSPRRAPAAPRLLKETTKEFLLGNYCWEHGWGPCPLPCREILNLAAERGPESWAGMWS